MSDLKSSKLIHLKGWLFLLIGFISAGLIIAYTLDYQIAILLCLCVWAFCRFYYYAFYVIEKYVDSHYKFAGLMSFMRYLCRKRDA